MNLEALRGKHNAKQQALWMSGTKHIKLILCAPQIDLEPSILRFSRQTNNKC